MVPCNGCVVPYLYLQQPYSRWMNCHIVWQVCQHVRLSFPIHLILHMFSSYLDDHQHIFSSTPQSLRHRSNFTSANSCFDACSLLFDNALYRVMSMVWRVAYWHHHEASFRQLDHDVSSLLAQLFKTNQRV